MTLLQLQDHKLDALPQPQASRYQHGTTAWAAQQNHPILVVTGMAAEARLAQGPGVISIMVGGNSARLRALLQARVQPDCRAVISVGIAGGLDPSLVPGDVVVATGVAAPDGYHAASTVVAHRLVARLSNHTNRVIMADVAGLDGAVLSPDDKDAVRRATGAAIADMESHIAAAFATRHGLPFAAVRVVCDPAHRALPHLVTNALTPDGKVSLTNVFRSVWQHPIQLLALPRLAYDAAEGFRALQQCRDLLGHGFGMHDDPEPAGSVDVVARPATVTDPQPTAT